jgi:peptide/nickel transport system substrate-binding protein
VDSPEDVFGLPEPGPVGTGPFKYESNESQNTVTFTRFEDYWNDPLPYLDEYTISYLENTQTRFTSLTTGDLDVAESIPTNRVSELEDTDGYGADVKLGPRLLRLVPNHTHWEPMSGHELGGPVETEAQETAVKFKKGLAYALNYTPVNEAIMGGEANVNDCQMPSFMTHVQELEEEGRLERYRQDQEKAMQLFEESGYEPPLDGEWNFITEQEIERNLTAMSIFIQQLRDIGFDPNPNPLIKQQGINRWRWQENPENPTSPPEDQHTFLFGHDRTTPDPNVWVGTNGYGIMAANNRPHWIGDMSTVRDALAEPDADTRKELWKDRVEECNKRIPEVSTIWYPKVRGSADYVHGLSESSFEKYDPRGAWIESDHQ